MASFLQAPTEATSRRSAGAGEATAASVGVTSASATPHGSWGELVGRVSCGDAAPPARIPSVHAAALAFKAALQQLSPPSAGVAASGFASFALPKTALPAPDALGSLPQNGGLSAALAKYARACKRLAAPGGSLFLFEEEDSPASGADSPPQPVKDAGTTAFPQSATSFYGVDVAAFASLRRQSEKVGAAARRAALAAAAQTAAAAALEEDLRDWRLQRSELVRDWLSLQTEAAASLAELDVRAEKLASLATTTDSAKAVFAAGSGLAGPSGKPHPLLTHVENQLLLALRADVPLSGEEMQRRLPFHLFLQLPAAAVEAAAASAMEFSLPSAKTAADVALPPCQLDGWGACSPSQTFQFGSLVLLLLATLQTLRESPQQQREGRSSSSAFASAAAEPLDAFIRCGLAVLEDDRRKACGAPDLLRETSELLCQRLDGANSVFCCGCFLALPWLQQAAAELSALNAAETEAPFGEGLWWLAVYAAFRAGDLLVRGFAASRLLAMGGGLAEAERLLATLDAAVGCWLFAVSPLARGRWISCAWKDDPRRCLRRCDGGCGGGLPSAPSASGRLWWRGRRRPLGQLRQASQNAFLRLQTAPRSAPPKNRSGRDGGGGRRVGISGGEE